MKRHPPSTARAERTIDPRSRGRLAATLALGAWIAAASHADASATPSIESTVSRFAASSPLPHSTLALLESGSAAWPLLLLAVVGTIALGSLSLLRSASLRRPSFWLATLFLLQISWAAATVPSELSAPLVSGSIRVDSAFPEFTARLAAVCFPLVIAAWLALTPQLDPSPSPLAAGATDRPSPAERLALLATLAASALGIGVLLIAVPLSETGLWAAFESPEALASRRETTFKLLPSALVKSAYGNAMTVAIPLAVALLASRRWFADRAVDLAFRTIAIAGLLLGASLSGARSNAAFLVILMGLVLLVRGPLPRLRTVAIAGGIGLAIVALMSVLPWLMSTGGLPATAADSAFWIARRAFSLPFQTGLWHLHYAATHGAWGFDGFYIPLRSTLGGEYADPATVVGRWYAAGVLGRPELSTTMNSSVLWISMASFGSAAGFMLAAALVLASDMAARCTRALPGSLGTAMLALLIWQTSFGVHNELVGRLFAWMQQAFIVLAATLLAAVAARAISGFRQTRSASGRERHD